MAKVPAYLRCRRHKGQFEAQFIDRDGNWSKSFCSKPARADLISERRAAFEARSQALRAWHDDFMR